MAMKKCPVCGASVKLENFERHVRDQHPRSGVTKEDLLSSGERRELERSRTPARPQITLRGKRLIIVVAVVIVALLALVILNPFKTGVQPGQVAPNFTVTTTEGSTMSLQSLRGKPVLLEFMDVDCLHCINEAPILANLYTTYSARVNFLSLDPNFPIGSTDTAARIDAFKTQYNTAWPYALVDVSLANQYGVTGTPTMFILNGSGVVVQLFIGETSQSSLTAAIDQALQG